MIVIFFKKTIIFSMLYRSKKSSFKHYLKKKVRKYKIFKHVRFTKEVYLFGFFCFLFFVIVLRLFILQVVNAKYYDRLLSNQHVSRSLLKADRWHIFVYDKAEKPVRLTENVHMYNVFVEPQYVGDKQRFIDLILPLVYSHLCDVNGMDNVSKEQCIHNIELFTNKELLPKEPQFFYYGSGIKSSGVSNFDWTGFNIKKAELIEKFSTGTAYDLLVRRLDKRIFIGINPRNYLWFFENEPFLELVKELPFVEIDYTNYVYINPSLVKNVSRDMVKLQTILDKYGYLDDFSNLESKFRPQENKYIKILSDVNPDIAKMVKQLRAEHYQERTEWNIPVLHGLWLESNTRRYYTYWNFLANVLGYVDKLGNSYYGIEQYFDELLAWTDGEIQWRSSAWMWQVGANEFEIKNVKHWDDVYLTVDMGMQREIEVIAKRYYKYLKADSVSILVYDPYNGHIKASVNAPSFDPNDYNEAYQYVPLWPDHGYLVDDITYVDVPVYIKTGWEMTLTTLDQRVNTGLQKFIKSNVYGSHVFVDKNVSMSYEPGSVFKPFTVAVGLDIDEIRFYDFYNDPWFVKIGPYTISNVAKECLWDNTFLHALVYSCNVGMVRIAQKVGKESFYNYLTKLGFWAPSEIELANADPGEVRSVATVSKARFYNNTFGQWMRATPVQLAAGYGAMVNGGYYIKPTIVAGIYDNTLKEFHPNTSNLVGQVFKKDTSDYMKEALFEVMSTNAWYLKHASVEGFSLGWKSWTSQITYKWKYQKGRWWTNGSFVGLVTKDDVKYIVVIQVRRPRISEWWVETAGKIFRSVAWFLVEYSLLSS